MPTATTAVPATQAGGASALAATAGRGRGIFFDRGELEQIMDAERTWHSEAADPSGERDGLQPQSAGGLGAIVGEVMQQARGYKQGGYGKHDDYSKHNNDGYSRRKRKESFLGDLFG